MESSIYAPKSSFCPRAPPFKPISDRLTNVEEEMTSLLALAQRTEGLCTHLANNLPGEKELELRKQQHQGGEVMALAHETNLEDRESVYNALARALRRIEWFTGPASGDYAALGLAVIKQGLITLTLAVLIAWYIEATVHQGRGPSSSCIAANIVLDRTCGISSVSFGMPSGNTVPNTASFQVSHTGSQFPDMVSDPASNTGSQAYDTGSQASDPASSSAFAMAMYWLQNMYQNIHY